MSRLPPLKVVQCHLTSPLSYSTSIAYHSAHPLKCSLRFSQMISSKGKRKLVEVDLVSSDEDAKVIRSNRPREDSRIQGAAADYTSRSSISPPRRPKVKQVSQAPNSTGTIRRIDSPIKLTKVEGLPDAVNVDTASLEDILSNPLVKECWAFNYLIDVEFLLYGS